MINAAIKPQRLNIPVRISIISLKNLKAYPSSKLDCAKVAIATKAIYSTTSGTNHSTLIAKSPSTSAPTTLKELLSALGVLSDAIFKASITTSITKSCKIIGTEVNFFIRIKSSHHGIYSGFLISRYHTGVKNKHIKNMTIRILFK
ncbi:hypothetical protein SDC9_151578 [bioreactor metagenome]|uniref:Uncharacterized protein n=1 Tax=bioreactor metagenome TaxID=1076179 RepID=A0A645EQP6_9ZZZZ